MAGSSSMAWTTMLIPRFYCENVLGTAVLARKGPGRFDVDAVLGGEVFGVSTTCDNDSRHSSVPLAVEVPLLLFSYEDAWLQKNHSSGWYRVSVAGRARGGFSR